MLLKFSVFSNLAKKNVIFAAAKSCALGIFSGLKDLKAWAYSGLYRLTDRHIHRNTRQCNR